MTLPRKVCNYETKSENTSSKNALKHPPKCLSPVQLPKSFSPALFHSFAPATSNAISNTNTIQTFLQQESAGVAMLFFFAFLAVLVTIWVTSLGLCRNIAQSRRRTKCTLKKIRTVIFFSLTEGSLPDPTPTPPNTPKRARNRPKRTRKGPKRTQNGPKSSSLGWDGRGVCRDGGVVWAL